MYHVRVFHIRDGWNVLHSQQDFPFGDFAEIGYWLDYSGYNEPDYRVEITFSR